MNIYEYWLMEKAAEEVEEDEVLQELQRKIKIEKVLKSNPYQVGNIARVVRGWMDPMRALPGAGTFMNELALKRRNQKLKELGYKTRERGPGDAVFDTALAHLNIPSFALGSLGDLLPKIFAAKSYNKSIMSGEPIGVSSKKLRRGLMAAQVLRTLGQKAGYVWDANRRYKSMLEDEKRLNKPRKKRSIE